ncbi:hypothetical protein ACFQ3W_11285 [Paenibacillus puldeungensis]|uniref:Uncharacterized protein n=1 Tax=Paenibacillus puldeungensis TaxID=696536 RepID=A0ABW3RXF8_9BACL
MQWIIFAGQVFLIIAAFLNFWIANKDDTEKEAVDRHRFIAIFSLPLLIIVD